MRFPVPVPTAAAVLVAWIGAGGAASAQPSPPSPPDPQPASRPDHEPCTIHIAVAPADARAAIEAAVAAEPRCDAGVELRVIPSEGGLYLLSRDARGRVHERWAPDVAAAALLVASWVGDVVGAPEVEPAAGPIAGPTAGPIAGPTAELDAAREAMPAPPPLAPSTAPATPVELSSPPVYAPAPRADEPPAPPRFEDDPGSIGARAPRDPRDARWLTLGAFTSGRGGAGVRAQLDLWRRRRWSIGAWGAWSADRATMDSPGGDGNATGGSAGGYLGWTTGLGPIRVTAQVGVGAALHPRSSTMPGRDGAVLTTVGEAALLGSLRLGERWSLVAGPIVQAPADGPVEVSAFAGLALHL